MNILTKKELGQWIINGTQGKNDYLLVVTDTFDYSYYPVYCQENEIKELTTKYNTNMQRVMQTIALTKDL
jgi:hypothetical protein